VNDPSAVDRDAAEAMLRAMHEHQGGSPLGAVADLIHPEAEMWLLVSFNRPLQGRQEVVEALERGRQAAIYRAQVERFEWLDDRTALAFARARYALEQGGFAEGRIVWLDEIRDGKIWRVRNFKQESEAREAFASREDPGPDGS
jgi:ketosteroid isomerase-like protein